MSLIHIGIGSNLGNRKENCIEAVRRLRESGLKIVRQSSMIETEPAGVRDQPRFINMAVEAETGLSPEQLLQLLKEIEQTMGRQDSVRWGPRLIDLDILFYDDLVLDSEALKIPHPLLHKRDFVLIPLNEIAPGKIHPVLKKTLSHLYLEYEA
jgi:2-amino-4-hydroxy-6-hydroxymethyldihydropteridine diphosphokinase